MLGRTLLQPATPLALGQKIAGWASDIDRATRRLEESFAETQIVQFGGASGSLSALGRQGRAGDEGAGQAAQARLAARSLVHAARAGCGTRAGHRAGLRRARQGRARHLADDAGRGGRGIGAVRSRPWRLLDHAAQAQPGRRGADPRRRQPRAACWRPRSSSGMVQEHERALGGWQSEWPTLAALCETLGSAVEAMSEVAPGLAIDLDAIQANMDATEAAVLAERATFLLAEKIGKQKAPRSSRRRWPIQGRLVPRSAGPAREGADGREGTAGLFAQVRRPAAGRPQT